MRVRTRISRYSLA